MDNRVKSVFGKYAEQLQVLVDTNLDAFKESFFSRYFPLGSPQMSLNFSTIIGKQRIEAAASVVAHGSEAPLRSRAGLERVAGEIAAIKVKRKMDDQSYREWLTMQAVATTDEAKKQQIISLIWDDVRYVVDSVTARMDWMTAQALSSGKIALSAANNPDGYSPGDVDLLVPAANKQHGGTAFGWTDNDQYWAGGGTADNPISDLVYFTDAVYKASGVKFEKVIMTPTKWHKVRKSLELTTRFDSKFPALDTVNTELQSLGLPIIELLDPHIKVETNGIISAISAWANDKYITFLPSSQAGIMHNALSIEQISPVTGVDYATANNILVSKWAQTEPFGEYTRGEIAAFPGLEVADTMYIVDTEART